MPTNQEDIHVVLSAFDAEAKKWEELAADMGTLKARSADLVLNPLAFFCGNPLTAMQLGAAYHDIYDLVQRLMADAATEFRELAEALRIAKGLYDGTDRTSAADFVKIYGEGQ